MENYLQIGKYEVFRSILHLQPHCEQIMKKGVEKSWVVMLSHSFLELPNIVLILDLARDYYRLLAEN